MKRHSQYRWAWFVCLLLLVGFIANSLSSYWASRENVRATITESSLPLTSDNIYSVIQRDLLKPIFISSMMSTDTFLRRWLIDGEQDIDLIEMYLNEIVVEYNTVTSFLVSEKTRNYYYAGGLLKQVFEDEPRDEWYFRVREMEAPFEINVDPDMANHDEMTIFINYRVFDFDCNYIGATGTGLTVNRVNQLIEEYEERFGRYIYFVDRQGKIILSPKRSRLNEYESIFDVPGLNQHATELLAQTVEDLTYRKDSDVYFLNSRFIPELDWYLMVEQTEDALLAPLRKNLYTSLGLALLITAVVAALCISAIQRHQKKLQEQNDDLLQKNRLIASQKQQLETNAVKLAEANNSLTELNKEKDDFLGIVAHDLRNPLGSILSLCEELESHLPAESKDARDYLLTIEDATRQMLELSGDMLNVTKIEALQENLPLEPASWNNLIEKSIQRLRISALRKSIEFSTDLEKAADQKVATKAHWMEICFTNLISNALKYSPHGSKIYISSWVEDEWICFSVEDEGSGIPEDEQHKLFKKFSRTSVQPTGNETSTGMGLYIVKKMCDRLGAAVEICPSSNSGANFKIRHPILQ